ncbi:MAG TPA: RimK family alpha-L-glutamate ligase [Burkholderiales bacterium]
MRSLSASSAANNAGTPHYLGLAALLRMNFTGVNLAPVCQRMIQRAAADPGDAGSLMDAAVIFQFRGQEELVPQLQSEALRIRRHFVIPAAKAPRLRLLVLMAPGNLMANVPIECLLEESDVELNLYYVSDKPDTRGLPEHDLLFVAIGESEANRPILEAWAPLLAAWPHPLLNNPRNIPRVARDTASRLLHALPGVAMPPTVRLPRALLEAVAAQAGTLPAGIAFPLIVRPVDSHAGHDLYKIETPIELAQTLAQVPAAEFFVSCFVDYRNADGQFRKYRVILIEGRPHLCHMAISSHWMIHYLNAGMAESPAKRAEEARVMEEFNTGFASRHAAALAAINEAIGLDYLGIDCAETADGRLLVFEVDPAMVVHAMDPVDLYPYKPAAMQRLFAAFRAMLYRAAAGSTVAEEHRHGAIAA